MHLSLPLLQVIVMFIGHYVLEVLFLVIIVASFDDDNASSVDAGEDLTLEEKFSRLIEKIRTKAAPPSSIETSDSLQTDVAGALRQAQARQESAPAASTADGGKGLPFSRELAFSGFLIPKEKICLSLNDALQLSLSNSIVPFSPTAEVSVGLAPTSPNHTSSVTPYVYVYLVELYFSFIRVSFFIPLLFSLSPPPPLF